MEAATAGRLVWCCTKCGAIYRSDFPRCPNDGAEVLASKRDPLVGTTLEHYRIEALIGEGAMGRVYRASHSHLSAKHYAIKVLIGDLAVTASSRIRFAKEAESASRLSHPNVVGVSDFGRTDKGLLYIAMELVDGEAAGKILDRGPMDPARVIGLARGVCRGLAHAHAAGIVHRDLKPDNILVVQEPAGEIARIVDFGLAITTDPEDARLTTTGMTMGTPAYIAPEQASGRAVDHRVDLYALGVSMFEMLTGGKLPFEAGDPISMVTAKVTGEAPPIEQVAPELELPRGLGQVVAKLLRRQPAQRYANADEVIAALDEVALGRPRRRVRPYVVGAAIVALAGVAGAGVWIGTTPGGAAEVAAPASPAPLATPPRAAAPAIAVAQPAPPRVLPEPTLVHEPRGADLDSHDATSDDEVAIDAHAATGGHQAGTPTRRPPSRHPAAKRHTRVDAKPHAPPEEPVIAIAPVLDVPAPPPPPPPPQTRTAQVAGVDVTGSLSAIDVRRAVERIAPALRACTVTGDPQTVDVRFSIGENRRAENVFAVGGAAAGRCPVAALGAVRTEAAPDVGEATVTVRISFQ